MLPLVKVVAVSAIVSIVFGAGYKLADYRAEAAWQAALNEAHEAADQLRDEFRKKELDFLNQEQEVVTLIQVQEKEIVRYVESTDNRECFDAAGIELFNQISTAAVRDPTGLP